MSFACLPSATLLQNYCCTIKTWKAKLKIAFIPVLSLNYLLWFFVSFSAGCGQCRRWRWPPVKYSLFTGMHSSNCCRVFSPLPEERRQQPPAAFGAMRCCSAKDQTPREFESLHHNLEREAKLITQYKPENTSRRFADDDTLREMGICTIAEGNGSLIAMYFLPR